MNQDRRQVLGGLALFTGAGLLLGEAASAAAAAAPAAPQPAGPAAADGRHDFDFYFGSWDVTVRRLKQALVGSKDWEEYPATDESRPIIGGMGCIDRFRTERIAGFEGMALRLFDPTTRDWHIYWADSRGGALGTPLVGRFKDGIGTFTVADEWAGKPVISRNLWLDIKRDSVRWEQAMSADDGKTWETNCIMHMVRTAAPG
jgi:hypothetical protein